MSSRGVVYVATSRAYLEEARRSASSLKDQEPGLSVTLFSDQPAEGKPFDRVMPIGDARHSCRDKIAYMRESPYDHTLYLDTDTHVCGKVSGLFSLLESFDVAAAHSPNRRASTGQGVPESFPEFQGGVILFRSSAAVRELLDEWLRVFENESDRPSGAAPRQGYEHKQPRVYDQPILRELLYRSGLRVATLAPEYNCRVGSMGYVCGEVKVLHGRRYPDLPDLARRLNVEHGKRLFLIVDGRVHVIPAHSKRKWLAGAEWYKIKV
jgi:hypothetical protein